ncbi:hypothetical protein JCM8547_007036 [Rhodosporidiobolus lusitaniae]
MDRASLSDQDLVDYLVVATEEQDAVFVLLWLVDMRRRETLQKREINESAPGVVREHSWKKYSAIVTAVHGEESPHRRMILELLMHSIAAKGDAMAKSAAAFLEREWATDLLRDWARGRGKERSTHVLSFPLDKAGDWLDAILPPHPTNFNFTGYRPLALAPSAAKPPSSTLVTSAIPPTAEAAISRLSSREISPLPLALTSRSSASLSQQVRLVDVSSSTTWDVLLRALAPLRMATAQNWERKMTTSAVVATFASSTEALGALSDLNSRPSSTEIRGLLVFFKIPFADLHMKPYGPTQSCFFQVPTRDDYLAASACVHSSTLRGHVLFIEGCQPLPSDDHPSVIVYCLPQRVGSKTCTTLCRSTRTGAYCSRVFSANERSVGIFRVPSPASAEEAVKLLDGAEYGGLKLAASWKPAPATDEEVGESSLIEGRNDEKEQAVEEAMGAALLGVLTEEETGMAAWGRFRHEKQKENEKETEGTEQMANDTGGDQAEEEHPVSCKAGVIEDKRTSSSSSSNPPAAGLSQRPFPSLTHIFTLPGHSTKPSTAFDHSNARPAAQQASTSLSIPAVSSSSSCSTVLSAPSIPPPSPSEGSTKQRNDHRPSRLPPAVLAQTSLSNPPAPAALSRTASLPSSRRVFRAIIRTSR